MLPFCSGFLIVNGTKCQVAWVWPCFPDAPSKCSQAFSSLVLWENSPGSLALTWGHPREPMCSHLHACRCMTRLFLCRGSQSVHFMLQSKETLWGSLLSTCRYGHMVNWVAFLCNTKYALWNPLQGNSWGTCLQAQSEEQMGFPKVALSQGQAPEAIIPQKLGPWSSSNSNCLD